MVVVERIVQARRIEDDHIGSVAHPQVPGVQAVPVREFAGEPVHRLFLGQERATRSRGVTHPAQEAEPEVVERHVAQMRPRVGEAQLHAGVGGEPIEHFGSMVGDRRTPTDLAAVLHHEVQERVHRMCATAFRAHLAEGLADHRGVGAFDDPRIEEVAVPHPRAESLVVIRAESATIGLVAQ